MKNGVIEFLGTGIVVLWMTVAVSLWGDLKWAQAQATYPNNAQLTVYGKVERDSPFTPETKAYRIGHFRIGVTVDSDLDRFFAAKEGRKVRIAITGE